MARPFNFFSFTSGGPGDANSPLFSGLLSGFYTPDSAFKNPQGFLFDLDADYFNNPASLSTSIRAFLQMKQDNADVTNNLSGKIFPVMREENDTAFSISGQVAQFGIDSQNFIYNWSGNVLLDSLDKSNYITVLSGKNQKIGRDKVIFGINFSGIQSSAPSDSQIINASFSGNVVGYEKDRVLLNIEPMELVWQKGNPKQEHLLTGGASLDIELFYIGWSRSNN